MTRSFPGADIGSDHNLVMMIFKLHLKRVKKQGCTRIKFDLEKLKDPDVAEIFQATIGRKFAALSLLDPDMDLDTLTNSFNKSVIDSTKEVLGKHRRVKKPWVTGEILDLCDKRRELKAKNRNDVQGSTQYREVNQKIKKEMKRQKRCGWRTNTKT